MLIDCRLETELRAVGDGRNERKIFANVFGVQQVVVRYVKHLNLEKMFVEVVGVKRAENHVRAQNLFGKELVLAEKSFAKFFGIDCQPGSFFLTRDLRAENQRLAVGQPAEPPNAAKASVGLQSLVGIADTAHYAHKIFRAVRNAATVVRDCDFAVAFPQNPGFRRVVYRVARILNVFAENVARVGIKPARDDFNDIHSENNFNHKKTSRLSSETNDGRIYSYIARRSLQAVSL